MTLKEIYTRFTMWRKVLIYPLSLAWVNIKILLNRVNKSGFIPKFVLVLKNKINIRDQNAFRKPSMCFFHKNILYSRNWFFSFVFFCDYFSFFIILICLQMKSSCISFRGKNNYVNRIEITKIRAIFYKRCKPFWYIL